MNQLIIVRTSMRIQANSSGKIRRVGTTLYLKRKLKSSACRAASNAGLTLSRYVESLLVDELKNQSNAPEVGYRNADATLTS